MINIYYLIIVYRLHVDYAHALAMRFDRHLVRGLSLMPLRVPFGPPECRDAAQETQLSDRARRGARVGCSRVGGGSRWASWWWRRRRGDMGESCANTFVHERTAGGEPSTHRAAQVKRGRGLSMANPVAPDRIAMPPSGKWGHREARETNEVSSVSDKDMCYLYPNLYLILHKYIQKFWEFWARANQRRRRGWIHRSEDGRLRTPAVQAPRSYTERPRLRLAVVTSCEPFS